MPALVRVAARYLRRHPFSAAVAVTVIVTGLIFSLPRTHATRWLAAGPDEIRHGFTARRLSGKDKRWMSAGTAAFGLVSPNTITPSPQTGTPDVHFEGGHSGGGGASSDF